MYSWFIYMRLLDLRLIMCICLFDGYVSLSCYIAQNVCSYLCLCLWIFMHAFSLGCMFSFSYLWYGFMYWKWHFYDIAHVILILTPCDDRRRWWCDTRDKEDERCDLEEKKGWVQLIDKSMKDERRDLSMQDAWLR